MKSAASSAKQVTETVTPRTVSKAHLEEHLNCLLHSTEDNKVELYTLPDMIPYRFVEKNFKEERMVQTVI